MSRIYFHTPTRTVEVRGSERAYMGVLASRIALAIIDPRGFSARERIEPFLRGPDYFRMAVDDRAWADMFSTWFSTSMGEGDFVIDGKPVGATDLALNTLIATRSPALALLAKLHGGCEDHAWVAAEDAAWFADLVETGRRDNVLRPEQGWEDVVDLARAVADGLAGPIVTSYSVTEGFPNRYVVGEPWFYPWVMGDDGEYLPNEPDTEAQARWDDLDDDEAWRLAVSAIAARDYNRQIAPETMNDGYMSGASAFDLDAAERPGSVVPLGDSHQPEKAPK